MTLLDHLATVPDPRRPQGLRHSLTALLGGAVMAMMSGHHGYRPISRFLRDNADALRHHLGFARHALPSHVTVRAVLQALDFEALSAAFRAWATELGRRGGGASGARTWRRGWPVARLSARPTPPREQKSLRTMHPPALGHGG